MKIAFSAGHPAHVHLFRNASRLLLSKGHTVRFLAVGKEITENLLRKYNLPYESFGTSRTNPVRKLIDLPRKDLSALARLRRYGPDVVISTGSPYFAHCSAILDIPHFAFGDTEIATWTTRLMLPFTDALYTPAGFYLDLGPKHHRYPGCHQLAYLHPRWFTARESVARSLAEKDERLILMRLSSWDSSHDTHHRGQTLASVENLARSVEILRRYGRVYISSEVNIPEPYRELAFPLPPNSLHDALAYSSFYFGEGATMASEAGVLGVPWVFLSQQRRGYLNDQERNYGLGTTTDSLEKGLAYAERVLSDPDAEAEWRVRRQRYLDASVDLTSLIADTALGWHGR